MATEITLHDAAEAYLAHLKAEGKSEATVYTYRKDFELIESFLGKDRQLAKVIPANVGKFFKSDTLLKKPSGAERAKNTTDKTKRVLRMFLVWAKEQGFIDSLPLPKDTPMGRSGKKGEEVAEAGSSTPTESASSETADAPTEETADAGAQA
jgi:site-specific recombinase XerD